ncbi:MAG: hypothetical protein KDD82_11920, partial [Planctomycetes bacterium]|nr:hypothetical protein [Planctomycetota bacterium]
MPDPGESEPAPPAPDPSAGDPTRSAISRWVHKTQRFKRPAGAEPPEASSLPTPPAPAAEEPGGVPASEPVSAP